MCTLQPALLCADTSTPSIEFLEYLADVSTRDGEWLDPLEMKNLASNDQEDTIKQETRDE